MFFYSRIPPYVFQPKKEAKEMTFFFIYDNYINFIYTWGNFDWLIKVTPQVRLKLYYSKCDQSYPIRRGKFDQSLIQNIFKKIDCHL